MIAAVAVVFAIAAPLATSAASASQSSVRTRIVHGVRQGRSVVFLTRAFRNCDVRFARLESATLRRTLALAKVRHAVRDGVLRVWIHGKRVALEVRCIHRTTAAGSPAPAGNVATPPGISTGPVKTNGLLFDGEFSAVDSNFPSEYGSCYSVLNPSEVEFNVTSACDPAGNGDYRTDLCTAHNCDHAQASGDYYQAGRSTCTSIPVQFPNGDGAAIPRGGWFQFAEAKDNEPGSAGWEMDVTTVNGVNRFGIAFRDYYNGWITWTGPVVDSQWHTVSICTNNANDGSGQVYGIWFDGVRQTFNIGPDAGATSIGGFPIIADGASSWPLDINSYSGPGTTPAVVIHGAPLISLAGSSDSPPAPAGGWNTP